METKKRISTHKKLKIGNYRIDYHKVEKYGDVGIIEVGGYFSNPTDKTNNQLLRHFNAIWKKINIGFDIDDMWITFDVPESLNSKHNQNGNGYITFSLRFKLEGLDHKFEMLIWEVLTDKVIELYENSCLEQINK